MAKNVKLPIRNTKSIIKSATQIGGYNASPFGSFVLSIKETTTPTPDNGIGKVYTKSDEKAPTAVLSHTLTSIPFNINNW